MAADTKVDATKDEYRGTLPVGTRLRNCEIVSILGHGAFGITYYARDATLGREVAIKEYLPTSLAIRADGTMVVPRSTRVAEDFVWGRERFLEEARILASLEGAPAVVRVHDFLEANGTAYMIMGLVRGDTLEQRLKRSGKLPGPIVKGMLDRLLEGLEAVHKAGFLHRDIKPANIMLDAEDHPTLIDFGASRASIVGRTSELTAIFTPRYAAVEQFTSDSQGPCTDIYGLSATLYHAITGDAPPSSLERALNDTYKPLAERMPAGFTRDLLEMIDAGLAVRAKDRPQSVTAWRNGTFSATAPTDDSTVIKARSSPRKAPSPPIRSASPPTSSEPQQRRAGFVSRFPSRMSSVLLAGVTTAVLVVLAGGYWAFEALGPATAPVKEVTARGTDDAAKQRAEAEARQKAQAEQEAEQQARQQAAANARLKAEAEARQKAESDAQAQAEARKAAAEAKARADADAKLKSDAEARRADAEAQKAAAEAQQKADADAKLQSDAEAKRRAEAEAQKAATEAQQKADADAKLKADAEAKQKAEADALAQRTAAEARQGAKAADKQKAQAEAAAQKLAAEIAETSLRLGPSDRQRIQVALTSLGFDTQGIDGVFGPRSRAMIQAWQQARNNPATGFLTAPQQQALLGQAASALAKFDEDQRKRAEAAVKAEAEAKANAEAAARANAASQPAAPAPNPPASSSSRSGGGPTVFFGLGSSGHGGGLVIGVGPSSETQSSVSRDQAYCDKLSELYRRYEQNSPGRQFDAASAAALENCRRGNPAAGIPRLEGILIKDGFTLPAR
ncbi:MAG: protein kinase [Proteobacteria bacterium]|nr:protein kinase [Pseudomonadota bacterium]